MQSKKQWVKSDSKDFAALGAFVGPFDAKGRTESAALLIWFLQTVYRLDDVEAEDAVCDRKHDEGFDALFVNDSRREVAVFQCKRREKLPATLGDVDLKNFVGSLAHLKTKTAIKHLANTTKNDQLARLIKKLDIAEKVGAGYSVRPVFVCNVAADANALKYLPQAEGVGTPLDSVGFAKIRTRLETVGARLVHRRTIQAEDQRGTSICHRSKDPTKVGLRCS